MITSFLAAYAPLIEEIVGDAAVVVTAASVITGFTNTPPPNTLRGKAYKLIEILGVVTQRAKQTGLVPAADSQVQTAANTIIALVRSGVGKTVATIALVAGLGIAGLGLSACGGVSLPQPLPSSSPGAKAARVTAEVAGAITGQCATLQPIFTSGVSQTRGVDPHSAAGQLGAIASFGDAYCGELQKTGALPATTTGQTPQWLQDVKNAEAVLAPIAQIALPLILGAI